MLYQNYAWVHRNSVTRNLPRELTLLKVGSTSDQLFRVPLFQTKNRLVSTLGLAGLGKRAEDVVKLAECRLRPDDKPTQMTARRQLQQVQTFHVHNIHSWKMQQTLIPRPRGTQNSCPFSIHYTYIHVLIFNCFRRSGEVQQKTWSNAFNDGNSHLTVWAPKTVNPIDSIDK